MVPRLNLSYPYSSFRPGTSTPITAPGHAMTLASFRRTRRSSVPRRCQALCSVREPRNAAETERPSTSARERWTLVASNTNLTLKTHTVLSHQKSCKRPSKDAVSCQHPSSCIRMEASCPASASVGKLRWDTKAHSLEVA